MKHSERDNRFEKCSKRVVESSTAGKRLWTLHPQWGGYGAPAAIDFDTVSGANSGVPGCFELSVYHDGKFPRDEVCFTRHCCSALQFVRFGLDVYEAQMKHQSRDRAGLTNIPEKADRAPVILDRDELLAIKERVDKLLEPV